MDRSDRVRALTGRIVVVLGLAVFIWAAGMMAWQDVNATGAIGIDTGYDGTVVHVEPHSAADAAGIRRGDVLDFASAHTVGKDRGDLGRAAVAPAHVPLALGTIVSFTLHPAGNVPARRMSITVEPATSPSLSEQILRFAFAALMLGFCAILLWRRSTPTAFAAFAFALGANPFTFYVQLVPLPTVPEWCATVALIDLFVAIAFGAVVLLALAFPPLRYGGSGWDPWSGLRAWYLWAAASVALLSLSFQLGLDLPPVLGGSGTGWLFPIDLGFDALVAAFGFIAFAYRRIVAKDRERARILVWSLLAYTFAIGGLIIQVYLTYAPPSEAGDMIAKRLSMSGLFMALVVGMAIVRDRGFASLIRAHFVRSAVSATAFVVLPPLEEHASDMIHKMHAPPSGGDNSEFSLATAAAIAIAYGATAIHHFIEHWREQREHHDDEERKRREEERREQLDARADRLGTVAPAAFWEQVASDPLAVLGLSAAAVYERRDDGGYARIALCRSGMAASVSAPAYFRDGEDFLGATHSLVRATAQPGAALVDVPPETIAVGPAGVLAHWVLIAARLPDESGLRGFALYARASERDEPSFAAYERAALEQYAKRARAVLPRPPPPPPPPSELVELDRTPYGLELLRSFRTRFAAENVALDVELEVRPHGPRDERRRVVVAVADGTPDGGAVFVPHAGWGFIELLTVSRDRHDTELGSQLVAYVERAQREYAGSPGRPFAGLLATASDPFHRPAGVERAASFEQLAWLGRLGFARVNLPYAEPARVDAALGATMLIARTTPNDGKVGSAGVAAAVRAHHLHVAPAQLPEDDPGYGAMAAFADREAELKLEPLAHYAGVPDPALHFAPIDLTDGAQFEHFAELYTSILPPSPSTVTPEGFRRYVLEEFPRIRPWRVYRLLGFGGAASEPEGFLSYFTLNGCGFAGYTGVRAKAALGDVMPLVVAYAEHTMSMDGLGADGWYTEIDDELPRGDERVAHRGRDAREMLFRRYGFFALDVPYEPPELPRVATEYAGSAVKPTLLLYKPFGAVYREPDLAPGALLAAVDEIYRVVYGVADPQHDVRYRRLAAALGGRTRVPIRKGTFDERNPGFLRRRRGV